MTRVGVISDTHGLLRPEALDALDGSELIVHAGDVGDPKILDRLAEVAPVHAVRGNTDYGPWAAKLPVTEVVQVEEVHLYVLHILEDLDLDPALGTEDEYARTVAVAAERKASIAGDLVPLHTGTGPDFHLATRAYRTTRGCTRWSRSLARTGACCRPRRTGWPPPARRRAGWPGRSRRRAVPPGRC